MHTDSLNTAFALNLLLFVVAMLLFLSERWKTSAVPFLIVLGLLLTAGGFTNGEYEWAREGLIAILLFIAGLHLDKLARMWKTMAWAGVLQFVLTSVVVTLFARLFVHSWSAAIIVGGTTAMSSTAICFGVLKTTGEMHSLQGTLSVVVLIFQDLAFSALALLVLALSPSQSTTDGAFTSLGLGVVTVLALLLVGLFVMLPAFTIVRKNGNRELYALSVVACTMAFCLATKSAGLSAPIGAMLAGLIIARHASRFEAEGVAAHFYALGGALMYVSLGTYVNFTTLQASWTLIPLCLAVIVLVKFLCMLATGVLLGYTVRTAGRSAALVSQIGETAIPILMLARESGVLTSQEYSLWAATAVVSLILSPAINWVGNRFANRLVDSPMLKIPRSIEVEQLLSRHVIIVGWGPVGHLIGIFLKKHKIPFVVIENRESNLTKLKKDKLEFKGYLDFVEGNCVHESVLKAAGIVNARALYFCMRNQEEAAIELARKLAPELQIVTRAQFLSQIPHLLAIRADMVIADEMAAALAMRAYLAKQLDLPIPASDGLEAINSVNQ